MAQRFLNGLATNALQVGTTATAGHVLTADASGNATYQAVQLTNTLTADKGGTGNATNTLNAVLLGNGTAALQTVTPGASGNVLTSNGTTWQSAVSAAAGASSITTVATIADLQALNTANIKTAALTLAGRQGVFVFNPANNASNVTNDPSQGVYVAPTADTTGATGAWVRLHDGRLMPEWFGTVGTINDAAVLQACLNLAFFLGLETFLTRIYTTTTTVNIKAQTIRGTGVKTSGLLGNHAGATLTAQQVSTEGMVLDNFLIKGNGTTDANGTSTGLSLFSTLEETSHILLSNLLFYRHSIGIVGGVNFSMFDSTLVNIDFWACSNYGEYLAGSQVTHVGCVYRVCNWGVLVDKPAANSVGGGVYDGCTWIQNSYDIVFNNLHVRPLRFIGCWFENSATYIIGRIPAGQFNMESLIFEGCTFQPSATAAGNGIMDVPEPMGIVAFTNCIVFTSPFANASLPTRNYFTNQRNLKYQRVNCQSSNGTVSKKIADISDALQTNQSVTTPAAGFAADTYLVGSQVILPAGGPDIGATYRCTFSVTKTAAGVATPIISLRIGTAGTTADVARLTFTYGAGTAVVDKGVFDVIVSFRTVGATTSAVIQGISRLTSNLATTGLSSTIKAVDGVSAGFDSTVAGLVIGLSYNGGTGAVHTIVMVRSELLGS